MDKTKEETTPLLFDSPAEMEQRQEWNPSRIWKAKLLWRILLVLMLGQVFALLLSSLRGGVNERESAKEDTLRQFYIYREKKPSMQFRRGHDGDWTTQRRKIFPAATAASGEPVGGGPLPEKVVVGTVTCSPKAENHVMLNNTLVMLKSIVVSARRESVRELEFHVFLEYKEYETLVTTAVESWLDLANGSTRVQMYFYDPVPLVPEYHQEHMFYHHRFRCGYIRFFFESALPMVDALIYLDADTVVTGSIHRLWQQFSRMDGPKLFGGVQDTTADNKHYEFLPPRLFGEMPYVPPRGINSGVLLMNLTKMRGYGLQEKMLKLYKDYSKINMMNDQRLLNAMLYYNPYLLEELDCQYNFIHTFCNFGFFCAGAERSVGGIEVIHGANKTLQEGGVFRKIWEQYQKFDPRTQNVYRDLIQPIQQMYAANESEWSECYGTMDKQLFKDARPFEQEGNVFPSREMELPADIFDDLGETLEATNPLTKEMPPEESRVAAGVETVKFVNVERIGTNRTDKVQFVSGSKILPVKSSSISPDVAPSRSISGAPTLAPSATYYRTGNRSVTWQPGKDVLMKFRQRPVNITTSTTESVEFRPLPPPPMYGGAAALGRSPTKPLGKEQVESSKDLERSQLHLWKPPPVGSPSHKDSPLLMGPSRHMGPPHQTAPPPQMVPPPRMEHSPQIGHSPKMAPPPEMESSPQMGHPPQETFSAQRYPPPPEVDFQFPLNYLPSGQENSLTKQNSFLQTPNDEGSSYQIPPPPAQFSKGNRKSPPTTPRPYYTPPPHQPPYAPRYPTIPDSLHLPPPSQLHSSSPP